MFLFYSSCLFVCCCVCLLCLLCLFVVLDAEWTIPFHFVVVCFLAYIVFALVLVIVLVLVLVFVLVVACSGFSPVVPSPTRFFLLDAEWTTPFRLDGGAPPLTPSPLAGGPLSRKILPS